MLAELATPPVLPAIPKLSICFVNYNAKDVVLNCLRSLYHNLTIIDPEIILVDNASQDGSLELIAAEFPAIILIRNRENRGFNRANNQALHHSTGDFILSLNTDTLIPPGSIEKLVAFLEGHPEYGAAGGRLNSPNGDFQWQCRRSSPTPLTALTYFLRLRRWFSGVELFHRYALTNRSPDESMDVEAISGACFMVCRMALEQTGGMDDTYFMYGDDLDWSYRLRQKGWKIRYCADAPIIHYGGSGGAHYASLRLIGHYYNAMWIFYQKHLKSNYTLLTTGLVWLGIRAFTAWHGLLFIFGLTGRVSRKK